MRLRRFARTSPAWRGGDKTAGKNRADRLSSLAPASALQPACYATAHTHRRASAGGGGGVEILTARWNDRRQARLSARGDANNQQSAQRIGTADHSRILPANRREICKRSPADAALATDRRISNRPVWLGQRPLGEGLPLRVVLLPPLRADRRRLCLSLLVLPRALAAGCAQRVRPHGGNGHFRSHLVGSGR